MVIFDGLPISPDKSYLREELATIDESWTAARFDSLSNVVHILTSKDREGEIQKIKDQSDVIEEVVDEVVHAYHGGFIKAIQNYSQILRLFSESTESISVLKVDLAESKKRLGTRNKQLHQLLYCSTLRHIISLLDQVENIAKALVAFTTEHEHLFTPAEYAILLKVRVREEKSHSMPTIEYQQSCPDHEPNGLTRDCPRILRHHLKPI